MATHFSPGSRPVWRMARPRSFSSSRPMMPWPVAQRSLSSCDLERCARSLSTFWRDPMRFGTTRIKSMMGASGRQRVQEACFDKFLFAHPDQKILAAFAKFVSPLFRMVQLLADRNANLRRTRDLLLPRLVTGGMEISASYCIATTRNLAISRTNHRDLRN